MGRNTLLLLAVLALPLTARAQGSCTPIRCDATGDTAVGSPDFAVLAAEFGDDCNANPQLLCAADCTGDTTVGSPDFGVILFEFGSIENPPPGCVDCDCAPQ